jgi:dipeptidyl aminopeptidase/acylaminoacyl peptidase
MAEDHDFEPSVRFKETLALSPDARHVAYIDDRSGQFNLVVQALSGGEARLLTRREDSTVTWADWHPSGESLVFLADSKGDERTQLHHVDMAGGPAHALTVTSGALFEQSFGYPFSPDGRWLVYTGNDRVPRERDMLLRDLDSGEVRRIVIEGATGGLTAGHWSPDGACLSAADLRGGRSDHVLYLVPATGGTPRRLTRETGATYWPGPWLPDGSGFLVRSNHERDFTGLAVMDAGSGQLSWLANPDWDVEDATLSGDGRTLVWCVNVDGASQLRARDLSTNVDLPVPTLPRGEMASMALSRDGRFAVLLISTPTRPWNLAVLDVSSGDLRWLTEARPAGAASASLAEPALVRYPSRDGRQIPAFVYRPARPGRVPVVLAIHGGPGIQERPHYSNDGLFQYLVSRGVAVLAPNARGSTGYGYSYQELSFRDWGGGDLGDFAAAAQWLRGQNWVDTTRIGLYGRSYGGFAVLSCVSRLPEFDWAAAVVWSGPSNLVTFTRAQPPTWRSKVATLIGDPDTDAEFLMSRSPVTYADQIRTPLMVIQGANDTRVPQHESDQIVDTLRERGVEVRYDVYPDEGHVFGRRENQTKARSAAAEFLLAHLTTASNR